MAIIGVCFIGMQVAIRTTPQPLPTSRDKLFGKGDLAFLIENLKLIFDIVTVITN
jgi:hypothetical protein